MKPVRSETQCDTKKDEEPKAQPITIRLLVTMQETPRFVYLRSA